MARAPQDVTDAELAVLEVLWQRSTATVREIAEELYSGSNASQHATVQKLLERLEGKKCVHCNRDQWPHAFVPAIERDELIGRKLQQTADRLCEGSVQPLLMHLVKAGRLSPEERRSLRDLLDELERKGGKSVKKK
jgi:BlaI family transcriptional regulator, penicillinase repressor